MRTGEAGGECRLVVLCSGLGCTRGCVGGRPELEFCCVGLGIGDTFGEGTCSLGVERIDVSCTTGAAIPKSCLFSEGSTNNSSMGISGRKTEPCLSSCCLRVVRVRCEKSVAMLVLSSVLVSSAMCWSLPQCAHRTWCLASRCKCQCLCFWGGVCIKGGGSCW